MMRQVAYRPRSGDIRVERVALPALRPGWVLVSNRYSLLSAGTERHKLEFARRSSVGKARARPDLVRKVVDRARVDGIAAAALLARERLAEAAPLGYSSAGVVLRVGEGVDGLAPGDAVACAGAGFANHAEVVAVPRTLVARLPSDLDMADAAYATVGAIALHAVRQSGATVGESVGVVGLGLVGQLALRILLAAGCRTVGVDVDPSAVALGRAAGAESFRRDEPALEAAVLATSGGVGLDAVLVCAHADSADPIGLAARLSRDGGRIVVVGDVPIAAERGVLYEKELDLRLARSYGPGRYDREYEERARELPARYVRWTEQRNLQAFVDLMAAGKVDPSVLTTHRFPLDRAAEAFAVLAGEGAGPRPFGVLLEYGEPSLEPARPPRRPRRALSESAGVGVVGAGAFARATLLPALRAEGARLVAIGSERGLSAADAAARFGFEHLAESVDEILADPAIPAVVIATRHGSHASLTAAALRAGKAVLVEKPLALDWDQLAEVEEALAAGGLLMVGFNRRFAPLVGRLRDALAAAPTPVLTARVNAGPLPADHWLHDPVEGGGRLLGEACHFVDLLAHLAGSRIASVHAVAPVDPGRSRELAEGVVATLRMADETVASLVYTGSGDARLPKERIEAFGGGIAAVLDDFRRLELVSGGRRTVVKARRDKGHRAQVARFLAAVEGREAPPPVQSYLASTRATLALAESLRTALPVEV